MTLIPYARQTFSGDGAVGDATLNFTYGLFPSPLIFYDQTWFVIAVLLLGAILSVAFTCGWKTPWVALVLWFLWASLFHRNNLIGNPSLPFIGWLLIAFALTWRRDANTPVIGFSNGIYFGAWMVASMGYTISGIDKLIHSPSWQNGQAAALILTAPLARDNFIVNHLVRLPRWFTQACTWLALAVEVSFLPLAVTKIARPWAWLGMTLGHLGILLTVNFTELTVGLLVFHLALFDRRWLPVSADRKVEIHFDGGCALCHRYVKFLMAENPEQSFLFLPAAHEGATQRPEERTRKDGIVLVIDNEKIYQQAAAIRRITWELGGVWRLLILPAYIVPAGMLDWVYNALAKTLRNTAPHPG